MASRLLEGIIDSSDEYLRVGCLEWPFALERDILLLWQAAHCVHKQLAHQEVKVGRLVVLNLCVYDDMGFLCKNLLEYFFYCC